MNCDEYFDRFLSAHADGQLPAAERYLAEEHLQNCPRCRARLVDEHALKAHIRHHAAIIKAPADVRLRIRAALGEAAERRPQSSKRVASTATSLRNRGERPPTLGRLLTRTAAGREDDGAAYRPGSARGWLALQLERARYLTPIGFVVVMLAGATMVSRLDWRGISGLGASESQKSVPAFDFAIEQFGQFSQEFAPNVPPEAFRRDDGAYFAWVEENSSLRHVSAELPDISASYEKMQMLPEFCDFALAGYELVGGRIDRMPNGEPVTYTLYRGQNQSILSIGLKQRISAPQGGYWFGTHALYSYRKYSICLTVDPVGHFASIIVARAPMLELLRNVVASDIAVWDR